MSGELRTPERLRLCGFAMEDAQAGETVHVQVRGARLDPNNEAPGPLPSPFGTILEAAKFLGHEPPSDRLFLGSGQVFYEAGEVVEVRYSLAYLTDEQWAQAQAGGGGLVQATAWVSPTPPRLTVQEDGVLTLAAEDEGRTHLSAAVVQLPDPSGTPEGRSFVSVLWDLTENAPAAALAALPPGTPVWGAERTPITWADAQRPSGPVRQSSVETLEQDGWTAHKPILGLAVHNAQAGEPVDVAAEGRLVLDADDGDAIQGNIRLIVACAEALGIQPPGERFRFSGGQVFYRDGKLEEVRLAGLVEVTDYPLGPLTATPVGGGEPVHAEDARFTGQLSWATDSPPQLVFNPEDESFRLLPEDEGRTHLSAIVANGKPRPDKPDEERFVLALLWDLRGNLPENLAALEDEPEQGTRIFPLSSGVTRVDTRAMELLQHVHRLRLPNRWSALPRWEDLAAQEVQRLQDELGEDAFRRDHGRDELLRRREDRHGQVVVQLSPEAERVLKIRAGLGTTGYLYRDPKDGLEYLVRLVQAERGYVEVGLSWYGMAGPLVTDWRQGKVADAERLRQELEQGLLWDDLDTERHRRLDTLLAQVRVWDHGRRVLELALTQAGRQGQNPVVIPAECFPTLLGLQGDEHWKDKVEGCLNGLTHLRSRLRSFDLGRDLYGYGTFLAGWTYRGRGPGAHAEGDYYLELGHQFLGCLQVFESGRRKLRGGVDAITYDWRKKLTGEQRGELGWTQQSRDRGADPASFHVFDAGRVFYNATEGLSPEQENLVRYLEAQLTRRKDNAAKDPETGKPWCRRARGDAEDAHEPRLYDRSFCPLLPADQRFHAALGHFSGNPETGRTLGGTARRAGSTGGPHHGGLLSEMGYLLETGRATHNRSTVQAALEDLRAVVVDYLGGVVVARGPDGSWLTAEQAQGLAWNDLLHGARWFLFLPETWREDRKRRFEERTGYVVTEDEAVARRVREARWAGEGVGPSSPVGAGIGPEGLPLRHRLHMAMKERGLTQGELAQLFGVSQTAVSLWFKGTEPDPDTGAVKGKPIPAELAPLVQRWVETGAAPTEDELAARKTRKPGRRGS